MSYAGQQLDRAAATLGAELAGQPMTGIGGRSVGCRVTTPCGIRWLRVVAVPEQTAHPLVWQGTVTAGDPIDGLLRPTLYDHQEWTSDGNRVRAELWQYIDEPVCSPTEVLHEPLELPDTWWKNLRTSLDHLAARPTDRMPRTQEQITRVIGRFFGDRVDPTIEAWTTAHGDLRWTNITTAGPYLLDWEFWGKAPAGADPATLYCSSLLVPTVADRVYTEFADTLDTRTGRLSQLCVAIQILRHPDCGELANELRQLTDHLIPTLALPAPPGAP